MSPTVDLCSLRGVRQKAHIPARQKSAWPSVEGESRVVAQQVRHVGNNKEDVLGIARPVFISSAQFDVVEERP